MLKTLLGLVTSNPYIALAGFLTLAGAVGGGVWYYHHLQQEIADANSARDAALTAQGKLTAQKTQLEGALADSQAAAAQFQSALKDAQAAADKAHADKAALEDIYDKVIFDAHHAPADTDGPVSPLLDNALRGLCLARPGATAAGCGG